MKGEHRKELETNVLADKMGRALHNLKEAPSRKTVFLLGGLLLAVVLYLIWHFVRSNAEATNSELWEGWYALAGPDELDSFAKKNSGSLQGRLAQFRSARLDLVDGLANLGDPSQRNQAAEKVRRAAATYDDLVNASANQPLLQQEAMLNAGKAHEALAEIDQAKSLYQRLAKAFPKTLAGKEAQACLERLEAGAKDLETIKNLAQDASKAGK